MHLSMTEQQAQVFFPNADGFVELAWQMTAKDSVQEGTKVAEENE